MSSTRDFKNPGIFAEDASTTIPPTPIAGVAYRDAVTGTDDTPNGWRYGTRVESQDWNQIMFLMTSMMGMMDRQGLLGWSDKVDYDVPALVFGSNGIPYLAMGASGPSTAPQDPISSPIYWQQLALHGRVVLTASQTWTVPFAMQLGYIRPIVEVIGGGGGGSYGGGGGGGYSSGVVDLTGVPSVVVSVGSGGAASIGSPSNGGNTSFGALSATGGGAGSSTSSASIGRGLGGSGSGGSISTSGQAGEPPVASGYGGDTAIAPGGAGAFEAAQTGLPGGFPGGGGGGVRNSGSPTPGAGASGAVIISW